MSAGLSLGLRALLCDEWSGLRAWLNFKLICFWIFVYTHIGIIDHCRIMYASPEACTLLCVSLADLTARCSIFDLLSSRHFDFLTRVLMLPPNSSLDMEVRFHI